MKFLQLKISPDLLFLIFGAAIWTASDFFPELNFSFASNRLLFGLIATIGLLFIIAGIFELQGIKTTVNPRKPDLATSIVTSGIYRFTRNPIYLGMFLLLMAFTILRLNLLSPLLLIGFGVYINQFQIIPEEKALTKKFGDEYVEYKKSVRRWI